MPDSTAMPDVATESDAIDQSAMVDDFLDGGQNYNTKYLESHKFTGDDSDVDGEIKTTEQPVKAVEPVAPVTAQPEKKIEGLDGKFYTVNSSGEKVFNHDNALGFFTNDAVDRLTFQPNQTVREPAPVAPVAPAAPVDNTPEWEKPLKAEMEYKQSVQSAALRPLNVLNDYISKGYDIQTAMQMTQQTMQEELNRHFAEREAKSAYERKANEAKEISEMHSSAKMASDAKSNELMFANTIGHTEYQEMMFSKDLGGAMVKHLFELQNPDVEKMNQQEYSAAMEKWWPKFASNVNNLRTVYNYAKGQIAIKHMPDILKSTREEKALEIKKQQLHTVKRPSGMVTTPKNVKPNEDTRLTDYFGVDSIDQLG